MTGQRLWEDEVRAVMPKGSYGRDDCGRWECCTPNGRRGLLTAHVVLEHPDGTITVSPSLQIDPVVTADATERRPGWHGFLDRGVWYAL